MRPEDEKYDLTSIKLVVASIREEERHKRTMLCGAFSIVLLAIIWVMAKALGA